MKIQERYLDNTIKEFLETRMVFVGGPRQVGKTTLCLKYLNPAKISNAAYLNWDDITSRALIKSGELPKQKILLFDEIHKFKNWRNLLKGFYDKQKDMHKFLVTGSARLDHYRSGGDSLLGRYRYLRLHPFTISELDLKTSDSLKQLLRLGGFPEPFFTGTEKNWKLWQRERLYRIVNDDIRNLENLKEYSNIELLAGALSDRIGSPLSIKNLSEDLQVNPRTVENWIGILEKVYFCFRIPPFGSAKIRAVKKEKKLYLWDWSSVSTEGARLENLVASHLLKYCNFLEDTEGDVMELRFLRDTDKREIDFVVLKNRQPIFAVECKTGEQKLSPHINYFKARTKIPEFYQVHLGSKDFQPEKGIRVLPLTTFCQEKKLV
jgi:predicted AAA+ superfamily ATPase